MSTTISTIQVAASSDDAFCGDYNWPGQAWGNATSTFVRLGYYMTTDYMYMAGFRFLNVPVPQGATINSATLKLYAHDMFQGSGSLVLTVAGEDVDDGATWGSSHTPYGAYGAKTSAVVDWTMDAWTGGNWYTSPDLATIIAEIVGRGGWASGNDLNLIIYPQDESETNYRTLRMYNYSGNIYGAKLDITYTASSPTVPIAAISASHRRRRA